MKKLLIVLIALSLCCSNVVMAGGPDAKDKVKIEMAKQKLFAGKFKAALSIFKEVLANNPNDGNVLYYIGLTFFNLKDYDQARANFEKAKSSPETNKETFYYLGKLYLSDGKFDEALSEFNTFKGKINEKENKNEYFVDQFISHCNNAKELMNKPVDVKIENMGNKINSQFDDKSPCITADGKKLVFTSRRPETTDAAMDVEGDGGYFEDIYISHWDTTNHKWGEPEPVPGSINTDAHDAARGISPDGKIIFIYYNDINGDSRGGDIYISKISGNKWKAPEPINKSYNCTVNTSYWEDGACISPDGKHIYFVSESPKYGKEKGFGGGDIWVIERISKSEWGKPKNLGADVNTPYQEVGIFLAPDGKTLFFCSNSPASMGDYDIFKTTLVNGKWTKPVNMGYPVNSERKDGPFVISADQRIGYFSSERKGSLGGADLYSIDLTNYAVLEQDMKKKDNGGLSILKGAIRDGFQGTGMEGIELKITDETGAVVASPITDGNGEYFVTLRGDKKYTILVEKKGFVKIEESIDLPLGKGGETFSMEKQFLLNKEK
jgi:Tol biopolymer transport system component